MFKNRSERVKTLKNIIIAVVGGAIGSLAFAPYNVSYAIIITLFTLCYFWYRNKHQARYSFLTMVSLCYPTIFWVHTSMTEYSDVPMIIAAIAILLLSAYLCSYHTLLIWLANKIFRGQIFIKNVFVIPATWIIADYLSGNLFTGFPWLYLGYTQTETYLSSLAPIGGVYLITLFMILVSSIFFYGIKSKTILSFAFAGIILTIPIFLTGIEFTKALKPVNVVIVQGNINQQIKWDPAKSYDIFKTYYDETKPYFTGAAKADIVVWPESALPELENFITELLERIDNKALDHNFALITGFQTYDVLSKNYYNGVVGLGVKDLSKKIFYTPYENNRYYKKHLVPIGEKVPFEELLRKYGSFFNMPMSSFTPGNEIQTNILAHGLKIATAICYEIAYPNEMLVNINDETSMILTVSNDGWFGVPSKTEDSDYWLSRGPMQHANIAKMRAIEFQKPVIRSTNTGLTAIYNDKGEELMNLPFYKVSTGAAIVTPKIGKTPFNEYGMLIIISTVSLLLSISFIYLLMSLMTKEHKRKLHN